MSGSMVLSILWSLLALCSTILLLLGSIIVLQRNKGVTAYLLLTGTILSFLSFLSFFIPPEWLIALPDKKNLMILLYIQSTIKSAGVLCFAIGFYKLVKSIGKTQEKISTDDVPPPQI